MGGVRGLRMVVDALCACMFQLRLYFRVRHPYHWFNLTLAAHPDYISHMSQQKDGEASEQENERQTDRDTDRQAGRQAEEQTYTEAGQPFLSVHKVLSS